MKQTPRRSKLALNKETVRQLTEDKLGRVVGGTTATCTVTCPTFVTCWSLCDCPSINNKCWPLPITVAE